MKRSPLLLIRNASKSDFGGGERFPTLVGDVVRSHDIYPIVLSRSPKVRSFAASHQIDNLFVPWLPMQNWSGWRILLIPLYIVWQLFLFVWYFVVFMYKRPIAVHIQSKDDFIAGTMAAKLVGARTIWTDHADLKHIWQSVSTRYRNPTGKLVLWAAKYCHAISVVSQSEKKLVTAHLTQNPEIVKKIVVIHNGCRDILSDITTPTELQPNLSYVIASRLVTDKGIAEAIEAFTLLYREYPDSKLIVVGDGPEKSRFLALAGSHPSITFVGHKSNPLPVIKSADIFLQPTYHEGFSIGLVEACMLAMPIITTNVGGNIEIIEDHTNGLLVPPKNTQALLQAMKLLHTDSLLRDNLAKSARQTYLQDFVLEDIVKRHFLPLYLGGTDESQS